MLKRVTVKNFKSLGDVTVDLDKVTVFVGKSGSGKSNFLKALRFLRNYLIAGQAAVADEGGTLLLCPFGKPVPISIAVEFELPGYTEAFRYAISWTVRDDGQIFVASEELQLGTSTVFAWDGDKWIHWPMDGKPRALNRHFQVHSFPTLTPAVLAYSAITNGFGCYDFPAYVLQKHPERSTSVTSSGFPLKGLNDTASNYLNVVRDLTQDLRDQRSRRRIVARLKQINSSVQSVELDSIQSPTQLIVGHGSAMTTGHSFALNVMQESDGFRRYYSHLLAIYQTPPKLVLTFEEPENGIYPGALANLAEEFEDACDSGRGQVLLTTQSPQLLDAFKADHIRVVELDPETHLTQIRALDPDQAESIRDKLLSPGELLTVDPARMAPPPVGSVK